MTIRAKVRLGVAIILAMFVALSGFTIDRMTVMTRHIDNLADKVVPMLSLTADMSLVLDRLRVSEAHHVLEPDFARMETIRAEIEALQARMYRLQTDYKPLITDPAQQAALDGFAADFAIYVAEFAKLRKMSEANRTDEALTFLRADVPIHARLIARIGELDAAALAVANRAGDEGQEAVNAARIGAIVAATLLACILGALIVLSNRDILAPMRRLIGAIDLLAVGELATAIPLSKRRDELGDVARALEHFRANAIEKERLEAQGKEDLAFAQRFQLASVPSRFPAFPERPELDIVARLAMMRAVGGDFYDFYFIDPRHLAIAIGDASGKGVASAMFASMARSTLRAESLKAAAPNLCFEEVNRTIAADNETMMFMTAFYGVLDLDTGELVYANAGHTPPYVLRRGSGVELVSPEPGLPLGVAEEFKYSTHSLQLRPGDAIVLYTDGITEAANRDYELFGDARLEKVLARHPDGDCASIVAEVFGAVVEFAGPAPQSDDIALLVVRYAGPAKSA